MKSSADNARYCPHCWPLTERHLENRLNSRFGFYLSAPFKLLFAIPGARKLTQLLIHVLKTAVLRFALLIGHAKLKTDVNRSAMDNCILMFWDEAKRRGIPVFNVEIGGVQTQIFYFECHRSKYYFDRNPIYPSVHNALRYDDVTRYDDKLFFKKFLAQHHFPCPLGDSFISAKRAFDYGVKTGFPLVVKPRQASTSIHVTTQIKTEKQLAEAIALAQQVSYQVIVEQHVPGDVYRAVLLDHQLIACAKRQAGSIVGNGKDTVEKLIDGYNAHQWRGAPGQLNATLHRVEKNKELNQCLARQQVKLTTKLAKNQKIMLSDKMDVGHGGDVVNVTANVHPDNLQLLQKISQTMNVPLVGLDFICEDVARPWQTQRFGILENNSLPGIGIHHFPSEGEPINVAGLIWDLVFFARGARN